MFFLRAETSWDFCHIQKLNRETKEELIVANENAKINDDDNSNSYILIWGKCR